MLERLSGDRKERMILLDLILGGGFLGLMTLLCLMPMFLGIIIAHNCIKPTKLTCWVKVKSSIVLTKASLIKNGLDLIMGVIVQTKITRP